MSQGSTPEIEVVRSFLKALEAKDLELAQSYVSDDVAYQNMPIPPLKGPKGIAWVFRPVFKLTAFEARVDKIASNGATVLTDRTDAVLIGPVRVPFNVCGTFEVKDGQITLWRDTFDYTSIIVNFLLAGPLYLFRKTAMSLALKAAARKG